MVFLFLPAVLDVIFAALDFFIFTASAQEDNLAVRESIVNRSSVWCVTISDECLTVAENDAARLGIHRPPDNHHNGLVTTFGFVVPVITILYVTIVCMCRRNAIPMLISRQSLGSPIDPGMSYSQKLEADTRDLESKLAQKRVELAQLRDGKLIDSSTESSSTPQQTHAGTSQDSLPCRNDAAGAKGGDTCGKGEATHDCLSPDRVHGDRNAWRQRVAMDRKRRESKRIGAAVSAAISCGDRTLMSDNI